MKKYWNSNQREADHVLARTWTGVLADLYDHDHGRSVNGNGYDECENEREYGCGGNGRMNEGEDVGDGEDLGETAEWKDDEA